MSTGDKIKEARQKKGISQKELACRLGTSPQNLAQYESGKRNPKFETLDKIANALNIDVWDLYDGYEIPSKQIDECKMVLTHSLRFGTNKEGRKAGEMLDKYFQLNEKGQDKAIEQVELLTKIPEYQKKDDMPHLLVNAAHRRTDIEVTEEMQKHDDDIMNDENF